jgi:hypothetical protein
MAWIRLSDLGDEYYSTYKKKPASDFKSLTN